MQQSLLDSHVDHSGVHVKPVVNVDGIDDDVKNDEVEVVVTTDDVVGGVVWTSSVTVPVEQYFQ